MQEVKVYHDQHIHTRFSMDSKEKVYRYTKKAKKAGVTYFISCEHVDFSPVSYPTDWICDFARLKKRLKRIKGVTPLLGIELGYRPDKLAEMNNMLGKYHFDLVQLSCHDDGKRDFYRPDNFMDMPRDLEDYFNYVLSAVTCFDDFDVLSHFDYGLRSAIDQNGKIDITKYEEVLREIFTTLINKNKALEINSKVQARINDLEYLKYILNLYHSLGGEMITLSSDAHRVEHYRYNFDKYMNLIKDAGFKYLWYYVDRKAYKYEL